MKNSWETVLREVRGGECVTELSERLADLVAQVRLHGKGGKLTLVVKVTPASRGDTTALMVDDAITVTPPKAEPARSIFFATADNLLVRNDPRQKEFTFKEVPKAEAAPLKEVNAGAA